MYCVTYSISVDGSMMHLFYLLSSEFVTLNYLLFRHSRHFSPKLATEEHILNAGGWQQLSQRCSPVPPCLSSLSMLYIKPNDLMAVSDVATLVESIVVLMGYFADFRERFPRVTLGYWPLVLVSAVDWGGFTLCIVCAVCCFCYL